MTAATAITTQTARSLLGLKRILLLGALELGPALIFVLSSVRVTSALATERALGFAVGLFFPIVVPVVAMILASGALGGERRDNTLSFLLLRPIRRSTIATAKVAGAVLAAVALNTVGAAALGGAHAVISGTAELVAPFVVGAALATTVYAAIFVPFGFLTDRAVIVGLIFVFVFENGVASALAGVTSLSPWRIGFSAFAGMLPSETLQLVPEFALGNVAPGIGGALLKTVGVLTVSVALTTWLLRSRDLT